MIKTIYILTASLLLIAFHTTAQHSKGMLSIAFNHYVDDQFLKLDSIEYKNALGQTYTITKFKYYISNICLTKANGKKYVNKDYFLINEDEAASKQIILKDIPEGNYTKLSFVIGVDSARNCSGAQSGALDPANAMFWAWNTGYIFLKLEGKAAASTAPGKILEYHIGGYKEPNYCIRKIFFPFSEFIFIEKGKMAILNMKVNAAEILKEPTDIDFSKMPSVVDSKNSTIIADNYSDVFSIQK